MNILIILIFYLFGYYTQHDDFQSKKFKDDFSLFAELKFFPECDSLILSIDANTKSGNSKKPNEKLTITKEEYIKLIWKHTENYEGEFYIQILNMYDEVFNTFTSKKRNFMLDLKPYNGKIILFQIFSEDCHVSEKKAIQVNIPDKQ